MRKLFSILGVCLFAIACNSGKSNNDSVNPFSEDIKEEGFGTYAQTKSLKWDSPEYQLPAGCTMDSIDSRLKAGMNFSSAIRMISESGKFAGIVLDKSFSSVTANEIKYRLRFSQVKGFSTIQSGTSVENVCTKNGGSWNCAETPTIPAPPEMQEFNNCTIQSTAGGDPTFGMGTYTMSGKKFDVLMTRYETTGTVLCNGVSKGMGSSISYYFTTGDLVSPNTYNGCRTELSTYYQIKVGDKPVMTLHQQNISSN